MNRTCVSIAILTQLLLGCFNSQSLDSSSTSLLEEYVINEVVLSVGTSQKLISFDLNLYGNKGFSKVLSVKKDVVKDIVVSHLSSFEMKDLKKEEFISDKLSSSFNQFFAGVEVSKVKLSEIKEL